RRAGVQPSIHRGWVYAIMRAWACVVQLDLQVSAVLDDIAAGRPTVYSTFLAYDEVAHHSGVERPEALSALRRLDREIARIAQSAEHAPREYRVVVLADHGQSQGATFLQRYGVTLEQVVHEACGQADTHAATGPVSDEAPSALGAALTEASRGGGLTSRAVRRVTTKRTVDGAVEIGEGPSQEVEVATGAEVASTDVPEISVMASGCLGLVSFPRMPGRVTAEQINARWPDLLPALTSHPGVGFVLVRSEADGPVVLGPRGRHLLATGEIEGEDPLAPFGPSAAAHVARTDSFSRCPDLVLNSTYWTETDEVAAFEELVGSHGGMGGEQGFPFVLAPDDLVMPPGIVGAEHVHGVFRVWLASLGHESFAA
ncbi:MAG: alkaline phosphatase family protein, partial [Solirubrobacteraceae bacterium]|nr:alkaline phosphatase family protein [Solirubrobacteraceae bacterium]